MKYTIATYEDPAARHMIGDWEVEMRADKRILNVESASEGREVYTVQRADGETERLIAVPIRAEHGPHDLEVMLASATAEVGSFYLDKALHFGRVPNDIARLDVLYNFWRHRVRP